MIKLFYVSQIFLNLFIKQKSSQESKIMLIIYYSFIFFYICYIDNLLMIVLIEDSKNFKVSISLKF